MRVLLDTNVLANSIAGNVVDAKTPPAQIWRRWRTGAFDLLLSSQVQEELQRVLMLPWFAVRLSEMDRSLALTILSLAMRNFGRSKTIVASESAHRESS
jgi:predicted nucleic acid-binding protein